MAQIVLASGSPRRRELLERIGITDFIIRVPEVDETFPEELTPPQVVAYISRKKAEAVAKLCAEDDIVITADTMVFLDQSRLGKPRDETHALEMLMALQECALLRKRNPPAFSFAPLRKRSCAAILPPVNPWTRRALMVFRAAARFWWNGWKAISLM